MRPEALDGPEVECLRGPAIEVNCLGSCEHQRHRFAAGTESTASGRGAGPKRWLGREDSNLRMGDPKSPGLPLADAPKPPYVPVTARDGCLSRSFSYSARIRSSMNLRVSLLIG